MVVIQIFQKDSFKTEHEIDISHNYITWGWESQNQKVKKGYCFYTISKNFYKKNDNLKYLLVLPPIYHYHFYNKKLVFLMILNLATRSMF